MLSFSSNLGWVIFGPSLSLFATWTESFVTMTRVALGEFDNIYPLMVEINDAAAFIIIATYQVAECTMIAAQKQLRVCRVLRDQRLVLERSGLPKTAGNIGLDMTVIMTPSSPVHGAIYRACIENRSKGHREPSYVTHGLYHSL